MKGVTPSPAIEAVLARLNPQQRQAATHDDRPLLIVAGAGTGKTATLVQRVAWLIARGVEPSRILLLTFTRRAAAEMLRRVDSLLRHLAAASESPSSLRRGTRVWGGTFHAVATRLLRRYGKAIGLPPNFTIHDRTDSEDLLNVVRTELGLAKTDKRFPKKGTCMAIYSRCVNARERLEQTLAGQFPWCRDWADELKRLLDGYVDRKEAAAVLDYDDLLLYWHALLADPQAGPAGPQAVRLRAGRRVSGHQRPAGRDPLPALARGQGADRGGRRRPVDLFLPGGRRSTTSSTFPNIIPTPRWSRWSRTIAARCRSSRPPTR